MAAGSGEPDFLDHLPKVWNIRYGHQLEALGWNVRLRRSFDYYTPDEWYSAALDKYVTEETTWLDVGCGRHILPQNGQLAEILAKRCKYLTGIDPSDNVQSNPFLHQRQQCGIESFEADRKYDLITLRMVAEHIAQPERAVAALARHAASNARIIIYTVWKWAPVPLVTAVTPMAVHHAAKRLLWHSEERDTFPVVYGMNTRRTLNRLFAANAFEEELFLYLDDCRSFQRWKPLSAMELGVCKALSSIGLGYPERCLLGVYRGDQKYRMRT